MRTDIHDIARWADRLDLEDIPSDVLARTRDQRRSVLGAVAAAHDHVAVRRFRDATVRRDVAGRAPVLGTDHRAPAEDALRAAAAASISLDHDDYACFAHAGHSAVLVPLLLAAEEGADGPTQLRAQVVANEVACRLGGASLLGPQNGQLWTAVHAAGSALAAGILLGLDADRLADALALALGQPPHAVAPALVGSDSKLLLAAEPAVLGVRAARLAAGGLTGPTGDVLHHPQGFLQAFADAPLPGMLGGLGEVWATRTLSVKTTPGCAYLTAVVEALHDLGPPDAADVAGVRVEVSLPTMIMDGLSASTRSGTVPHPTTVTFSTPLAVAVTLIAGGMSPDALRPERLARGAAAIRALAGRVEVAHDPMLTAQVARSFATVIPPFRVLKDAGLRGPLALRRRTRGGDLDGIEWGRLGAAMRSLRAERTVRARRYWDPDTVGAFRMVLPARVAVRLRDGRSRASEVMIPQGAAGHPEVGPEEVAREKLARHGPALWGPGGTRAIAAAIDRDADDLWDLL